VTAARILILHDEVPSDAPPDQADALVQARLVAEALGHQGYEVATAACGLDLAALAARLRADPPALVFNLVESLGGHGRLIAAVPTLLDALAIPYAGAPAEALSATSDKLLAKRLLRAAGLPTPPWFDPAMPAGPLPAGRWIVKSVWEHASIGLNADSIFTAATAEELASAIAARRKGLGGSAFAEAFIDGREFNLSVLAGSVLPPAEIRFEDFPAGVPCIVDYAAKWDAGTHAYHHTPRTFDFPPDDTSLLGQLRDLAAAAWRCFGLRGAARVDFRVDATGRPWILEVNANPCLSPDAGFMAAADRAGLSVDQAIARIVTDRTGTPSPPPPAPSAARSRRRRPRLDFRHEVGPEDAETVRRLATATGFFRDDEVAVAVELVQERLAKGPASGYFFVFAVADGRQLGYACYGPIACTVASQDLFWIVVDPEAQGRGIGQALVRETERLARRAGGTRLYAETSSTERYSATRRFYEVCGFRAEAVLADFYAPGDGKVVFCRELGG
jgi:D-alanine-D-alanine ligase-like ATP-grasp enzyme/GNAT superfamily N-acetyltransferase